jgi:hypothetical protein
MTCVRTEPGENFAWRTSNVNREERETIRNKSVQKEKTLEQKEKLNKLQNWNVTEWDCEVWPDDITVQTKWSCVPTALASGFSPAVLSLGSEDVSEKFKRPNWCSDPALPWLPFVFHTARRRALSVAHFASRATLNRCYSSWRTNGASQITRQ